MKNFLKSWLADLVKQSETSWNLGFILTMILFTMIAAIVEIVIVIKERMWEIPVIIAVPFVVCYILGKFGRWLNNKLNNNE